jgi:hypothetical protein
MKILIAAASLVLVQQVQQTATIQPGQIEESCMAMAAGERLEFSFSANTGLDFNIHYHDDKEVHFPVNESALSEWKGVYIAPTGQHYCLMWTNKHATEPASLSYAYEHYRMELE